MYINHIREFHLEHYFHYLFRRFTMKLAVTAVFVLWVSVLGSAQLLAKETKKIVPITPLKLVAEADGKQFYAEYLPKRTWWESKLHCISQGMRLAMITSQNQMSALKEAWSTDFNKDYWIDAHDSKTLKQFAWDRTGGDISVNYRLRVGYEFYTCLNYDTYSKFAVHLVSRPCFHTLGTLCESVV